MIADTSFHRLAQVLKVINVSDPDEAGEGIIRFSLLDGSEDRLYYTDKCKAIVINHDYQFIDLAVICGGCGDRFGNHYVGQGAPVQGVHCHKSGSGIWFVPDEQSLMEHHPEAFADDGFFSSLGL
jgi:hypothetical protein